MEAAANTLAPRWERAQISRYGRNQDGEIREDEIKDIGRLLNLMGNEWLLKFLIVTLQLRNKNTQMHIYITGR